VRDVGYKPIFLVATLLVGFAVTDSVGSEVLKKQTAKDDSRPIVIKSKTLEVNDKTKVVTFEGDVRAEISVKSDDFVIDCKKMLVYYKNPPSQQEKAESETKLDRIVATGDVRFNRGQGGVATAEKAVYYQEDEKIVLTGRPVVKQGKDSVEGDKITIFLEENRHIVESLGDKKVRAIIFPKSEKR